MGLSVVSFTGRFVPEEFGGKNLGPIVSFILRMLMACFATVAVVLLGASAMLLNTAPEWLSLMLEPVSLVLLPGLAAGLISSSPHDLDPGIILDASLLFYFFVFFLAFEALAWRKRRRLRRKTS